MTTTSLNIFHSSAPIARASRAPPRVDVRPARADATHRIFLGATLDRLGADVPRAGRTSTRFDRLLTFPRKRRRARSKWERENAARHARGRARVRDARGCDDDDDDDDDAIDRRRGAGAHAHAGLDER
jgi:hypothetical protein